MTKLQEACRANSVLAVSESILVEILRKNAAMLARVPPLNNDVISHIVSFVDFDYDIDYDDINNENIMNFNSLHHAAQISRGFWIGAKRKRQQIIEQDQRNRELTVKARE